MPYIKPKEIPFAKMRRLLLGYEMDSVKLARILGCSLPTARARLKSPELLTLGEVARISRIGHIPIEEIREAISQ